MNRTTHSVVSPFANDRETTYHYLTFDFISYLYVTNMAMFTLFILTDPLNGMAPSEFVTRHSLTGSSLLVLLPPTVTSAPRDKSARISGKLNKRNQGVKAWMSEKFSGRGSVFYPRNSLRPTFISSFGNLFFSLLIFLFFPSLFWLGLIGKVYMEWPKEARVNGRIP